jgi:putative Mn2+ efflux pump MntP
VGLSTDAFSVAISNGMGMSTRSGKGGAKDGDATGRAEKALPLARPLVSLRGADVRKALAVAAAFGGFQAVMPTVGYFAGGIFTGSIEIFDHVIALVLLAFIGGRMMREGVKAVRKGAPAREPKDLSAGSLLLQAVATSIDALMVGVGFAAIGLPQSELASAVVLIGATTFALSFAGVYAGKRFGTLLGSRAEIVGGLILIAIGVKIFIEDIFL